MSSLNIAVMAALLIAGTFVSAQSNYQIKRHSMSISGTSNLHDWTSQVNKVSGKGTLLMNGTEFQGVRDLSVSIDVYGIKSSKGSIMDSKTYDALKASQYNTIIYQLGKVESVSKSGADFTLKTSGYLTIAGSKQPLSMDVKGKTLPNGEIEFSGSKRLKMTTFNISPPTALMGTMKTGDEITVNFSVTLAP